MILDIEKTFHEICPNPDTFRQQLKEISEFRTNSHEIRRWAENLRLITSHPASRGTTSSRQERTEKTKSQPNATITFGDESADAAVVYGNLTSPSMRVEEHDLTKPHPCTCNAWSRQAINFDSHRLWVTDRADAPECPHFVAVSYCWPQPTDDLPPPDPIFTLYSNSGQKANDAPNAIIERAIHFANVQDLSAVWIDQECINQTDREDKESGIQSMDLVYENAESSVALLSLFIDTQDTIDLFDVEKLSARSFDTPADLDHLSRFVQWIDTERWFTRAWCMQESWSAGVKMQLMIKHGTGIVKPSSLGDIDGEVVVNYQVFCYIMEMMISKLENDRESSPGIPIDASWLKRFRRKVIKLHPLEPDSQDLRIEGQTRLRCSAAEGLYALAERQNSRIVDRLAILGNLCDYSSRLNTEKLEEGGYSFSVCAVALATINGDISLINALPLNTTGLTPAPVSDPDGGTVTPAGQNLERLGYCWGPLVHAKLSNIEWVPEAISPVRLFNSEITPEGLRTSGYIFECDLLIDVTPVQRYFRSAWDTVHAQPTLSPEMTLAFTKLKITLVWNVVRYLIHEHYFHLAQIIWQSENDLVIMPSPDDDPDARPPSAPIHASNDIMTLIDLSTGEFIHPSLTETSFLSRLGPRGRPSLPSRDWLAHTVMTSARLVCGRQISAGVFPASAPTFIPGEKGPSPLPPGSDGKPPWERRGPGAPEPVVLPFADETVPGPSPILKSRYRAVFDSEEGLNKAVFSPMTNRPQDPGTMGRFWVPGHWAVRKLFRSSLAGDYWKVIGGGMVRGFVAPEGMWSECWLV